MFITFFVSSIGHELVMGCITKKIRGYGILAMMMQLPIVAFQRSKLVKGRKVFNVSNLFTLSGTNKRNQLTTEPPFRMFAFGFL